jgi:signal transduction histidine kinase
VEVVPQRSVLFVGADAEDASTVASTLAQIGWLPHHCTLARTLAEARERAEGQAPDVVLFDSRWPDCPGLPGVVLLRSLFRGATLVVIVAEPEDPLAQTALEQGAADYLCKSELRSWLGRLLRHAHERQLSERQRQLYEAQLRESERLQSLGKLAAGIAHEINTPAQFIGDNLAFLGRALQLLGEPLECALRVSQVEPECVPEALRVLRHSLQSSKLAYVQSQIPLAIEEAAVGVESISSFVCSIAQYAQPVDGRRIPTDLTRVLDTSLNVTRNAWRHLAELRTEYAPGLPLVTADPSELTQVFVNLIVNAADALSARAADAKGQLTVGTRRCAEGIEAWVSDTGIGIAPDHLGKIFDPSFTTKRPGTALGRGLAVAREIIHTGHGGKIHVDSRPGSGATFVILLPLTA